MNKKKIVNDPVYGFLTIPGDLVFDLIQHPYFQRLRRIRQLGLSEYVYPGALHTRFHHALGALNLLQKALDVLKQKGVKISDEESEAVSVAILLHDIGHGPFSHSLEHTLVNGVHHEELSLMFMQRLNSMFNGKLTLAIEIFKNKYPRKFLNQLISSQLDMDRLDYLSRDSFFTGVSEGIVGADRIINMLFVVDDELVVEEKGIYSVEKFIIARRLMYWQVYLHKTVLAAEVLLLSVLKRAKELTISGTDLFGSPALKHFLNNDLNIRDFEVNNVNLEHFSKLDDYDVMGAIKVWQEEQDEVLKLLSRNLIERHLPKIEMSAEAYNEEQINQKKNLCASNLNISNKIIDWFVITGSVENNAYKTEGSQIKILQKNGTVKDVAQASDNYNLEALKETVKKYYISFYR